LIDGHARIEEVIWNDPDQPVPYLKVDLSEAEEKAVLATLDPIGAMAEVDPAAVDRLYQETIADMPELEQLLIMLHRADTAPDEGAGTHEARLLTDQFIVPPFTVLDARQGYWQDRKTAWLELGIQSELGRGDGLTMSADQVTTENLNYYRNRSKRGDGSWP
jgi:hypothetical protein